jgi:hypothetical protein
VKIKFEWEEIYDDENKYGWTTSCRSKVIGGWIVMTVFFVYEDVHTGTSNGTFVSNIFIPDPNHEWEIDKE